MSFDIWIGATLARIGLDDGSKTVFVEINGDTIQFAFNSEVWDDDVTNQLSMIRIVRKNNKLSCYLNDFKVFEEIHFDFAIDAFGWRPYQNTISIKTLSMIKPFTTMFRISFQIHPQSWGWVLLNLKRYHCYMGYLKLVNGTQV